MSRFISYATLRSVIVGLALIQLAACSSPENRAQGYYEHGKQLMASHEDKRAAIEFLNAVKYNRKLLPAWESLAQVEEQTHNWGGLAGALRGILELKPDDMAARLKLGRLLLVGGAYDDALKLVNEVKEPDGQNADLLALKASILFKLKDAAGAVKDAQAALKLDPKNVGAMFVLASDDLARGDAKSALAILDSPAVTDSKAPEIGVELFKLRIFEQTQQLPQAEVLLKKLIQAHPKELSFKKELIRLYLFQHRNADAEKEQRAIVAADPKNSQAQLDLVRMLGATQGPGVAQQQLESLIKAGGDVFPYQIALAQVKFGQGDFAGSVALLLDLIKDPNASPDHVVAAQLQLAQMYLAKGRTDEADALVSAVLAKDARNIAGLKLRASIEMNRGQLEKAIADLRQALNDQPRAADLMLMLAVAYERNGTIDLAEKEFADAMQVSNYNPTVSLNYVAFLQRRGNIEHAEDVLTDLASRWPKNIQVLSALAQIKLARQEWGPAQQLAQTIKRLSANPTAADEILGAALAGENKYDESIAAWQNAYASEPNATQPMYALVRTYLRAQQPDKAVTFLQSVLKASPDNPEAYVLLGSVQLSQKKLDQAKQNFQTAIQKAPTSTIGYRALADLYLLQKDDADAIKVTREGLKQQPNSFVLRLALAGGLERSGDYEGAISEYEGLFKQDPGSIIVANNLASLLADYRTDKASLDRAKALAAVLQKSPLPQFKDTLGWVSYRQGDYKAALPLLETAATALPGLPLVHYHLGMTYVAVGQTGKAAEQFKTALKAAPDKDLQDEIQTELAKIGTQ